MNKQLLRDVIGRLQPRLIQRLRDYAKFPTERNECYMTGYITALNESGQMEHETYTYLLALCGRLCTSEEVRNTLKEELT